MTKPVQPARVPLSSNPDDFSLHLPIQVRFNDVDALGHVNNSMHQQYFDLGRVHYFNQMPSPPVNWYGQSVVIARLEIDFYHPISPTDRVFVCTRVITMGNRSFRMEQLIYREKEGRREVCSRCISTMVGFDAAKECSAPIPEAWKKHVIETDCPAS